MPVSDGRHTPPLTANSEAVWFTGKKDHGARWIPA